MKVIYREQIIGNESTTYKDLNNKPIVNDHELEDNKTSEELDIVWSGTKSQYNAETKKPVTLYVITDEDGQEMIYDSYTSLNNKPSINGEEVTGNKQLDVYNLYSDLQINNLLASLKNLVIGPAGSQKNTVYLTPNGAGNYNVTCVTYDGTTLNLGQTNAMGNELTTDDDLWLKTQTDGSYTVMHYTPFATADNTEAFRSFSYDNYGHVTAVDTGDLLDLVYPIGSLHMTTGTYNPGTEFGGTWQLVADNRMLLGTDDAARTVGETGGSDDATFKVENIPGHTHEFTGIRTYIQSPGVHTHTRGTMNVLGELPFAWKQNKPRLALRSNPNALGETRVVDVETSGTAGPSITMRAGGENRFLPPDNTPEAGFISQGFDGYTSLSPEHTHTIDFPDFYLTNTGAAATETTIDVTNPYYSVYIWERIA